MELQVPDQFLAALNRHDVLGAVSLIAEDGVYEHLCTDRTFVGKRVLESLALLNELASDLTIDRKFLLREGNRFATEWEITGTHDRYFSPFELEPTGGRFKLRGASLMAVEAERLTMYRSYYDLVTLLRQLGVHQRREVDWRLGTWTEEGVGAHTQTPEVDIEAAAASEVVDAMLDAWNNHDGAALVSLMADDGIYEIVATGQRLSAREVGLAVETWTRLTSCFAVERISTMGQGGHLAVEFEATGINDRPFTPFSLSASGSRFSVPILSFFVIERGRIKRYRGYWNLVTLLNQIGCHQPGQIGWKLAEWEELNEE